jgi:hypothetical protein
MARPGKIVHGRTTIRIIAARSTRAIIVTIAIVIASHHAITIAIIISSLISRPGTLRREVAGRGQVVTKHRVPGVY